MHDFLKCSNLFCIKTIFLLKLNLLWFKFCFYFVFSIKNMIFFLFLSDWYCLCFIVRSVHESYA